MKNILFSASLGVEADGDETDLSSTPYSTPLKNHVVIHGYTAEEWQRV